MFAWLSVKKSCIWNYDTIICKNLKLKFKNIAIISSIFILASYFCATYGHGHHFCKFKYKNKAFIFKYTLIGQFNAKEGWL